jgi:16S rRNA processing protein RimM
MNNVMEAELHDVCIGVIVAANGIKGYVKIKCFTASPEDIENFSNIFDPYSKRSFDIKIIGVRGDCIIGKIAGIESRNEAEKLQNTKLYIKRSELPTPSAEEFYHNDLIGCKVQFEDGLIVGEIKAVHNFGAGDIIEVYDQLGNKDIYYPFNKEFILEVNLNAKCVTISRINEILAVPE